jgi:hypothetical protein
MGTHNGQLVHLPTQTTLSRFEAARYALEQARTVDEIKEVRDRAEALRTYCARAGASLAVQNDACEIRLRAERKAGSLLAETGPPPAGVTGSQNQSHMPLL